MNEIKTIKDKIYRKLHYLFWHKLHPGRWSLYLFAAYRHYKLIGEIPDNEIQTQHLYLTQEPNRGAGIGHQLSNWNSGYHYAKMFGINYAYSTFSNQAWDSFLGFGEGEVTARELLKRGYKKRWLPYFDERSTEEVEMIRNIIRSYSGKKVVFYTELDQFYINQYEIMDDIRDKFDHASARQGEKLIYKPECLNIAVHIRRGDIVIGQENQDPSLTKRWLTTQYYARILTDMVKLMQEQDKSYQIYLFSQGKEEDFPELKNIPNLVYCLDMPPRESFLHMVRADILVTSKSSFSYKPALLSKGIRICPKNFWHGYPNAKEWILVEEDEGLTKQQLDQLCELLQEIEEK